MRIEAIEIIPISIPLRQRFTHATSERTRSDMILVRCADQRGVWGWGEALPRPYVTGETLESVGLIDGPARARAWHGQAFESMAHVEGFVREQLDGAGRNLACFGAFESALLDLAGQHFGVSLAQVLGGIRGPELPAGVVIGFDVETDRLAKHCAALRFGGRRHVKVKVGRHDDVERLGIVARVFAGTPIRIDANGAWAAEQARARLGELARFDIASVEQPLPAVDLAGAAALREQTGLKIMADESVCTLADAQALVAAQAADVFNIRLGKHGGVLGAARICDYARGHNIALNLGTLVGESGILSRAAEVFGRCTPGFDHLDGKGQNAFLLAQDILDPTAAPPDDEAPGLGVCVALDRVMALATGPVTRIG